MKKDTTVRVDQEIQNDLDKIVDIDEFFETRSALVRYILRGFIKKYFKKVAEK